MTHIVYLNPHADDFIAKPVSFALAKRRALKKYAYLFDGAIAQDGNVDVLVDGSISSLIPQRMFMWLPKILRLLILKIEVFVWLQLNELQDKADIHWNVETLSPERVLYLFSYKNCVAAFHERKAVIEHFHRKIINLSHYFICTKEKAQNIAALSNVTLVTEADLRENEYFKHFFKQEYPILVLPFQVGERFEVRKGWDEREARCAATGSFHNLHEERPKKRYLDFIKFFNMDSYHPVRKLIYRHQDELSSVIETKISPYREKRRHFLVRIVARFFDSSQKKYFSFDIVDFYNSYQAALVGEEVHGLPAIGAFEAMACGCVLVANGEYYKGLGLESGTHYIEHDETLEGIKGAVKKVVSAKGKSKVIADAGVEYVNLHCRGDALWKKLSQNVEGV